MSRPQSASGVGFGVELVGLPEMRAILAKYEQPQLDKKLSLGLKAAGRSLSKSVRSSYSGSVRSVRPGFRKGSAYRQGDLYRSIGSRTLRGNPPAVVVGPVRGRATSMRHLAIRPTKAHVISPLRTHFLAVASFGTFATVVHHPGNHAHPWVERGIDAGHDAAIDKAANAIFRDFVADPAIGGDD